MKKLVTILGIMILVSVLIPPAFAYRGGCGGQFRGSGDCWGGRFSENLTEDQRAEMDKLQRSFFKDTSKHRNELWTKSEELDFLLDASDPDPKEVRNLQKDISNLRAQLAEKRIDLELETRKIAPKASSSYGRGCSRGYGKEIRGCGSRGGSRAGGCW